MGNKLNPENISAILKALQEKVSIGLKFKPLIGHLFRLGAVHDLLEQGISLERIMPK